MKQRLQHIVAATITSVMFPLLPLTARAADQVDFTPDYTNLQHEHHSDHDSALAKSVANDLKRYTNFRQALVTDNQKPKVPQPQWVVGTPCVSGPDHGAMGIHLVNPNRFTGAVVPDEPTALIYEPQSDGDLVLVGVEYIRDFAAWSTSPLKASPPSLDGHLFNFVDEPNRYGLPAFYEIHLWAFEANPKGAFADWNTHVTCEKEPINFRVKP